MSLVRAVASVVSAALISGCLSTWEIPRSELTKLDGYRAPATVFLKSTGSADVKFGPDRYLIRNDENYRVTAASVSGSALVCEVAPPHSGTVTIPFGHGGTVSVGKDISPGVPIAIVAGVALALLLFLAPPTGYGF